MKNSLLVLLFAFICQPHLFAESINNTVWRTELSKDGHVHVKFETCGGKICGHIIAAFDGDSKPGKDYVHLRKKMVWDMKKTSPTSWGSGKIWDPSSDKTYKSKMKIVDKKIKVSGCVLFICKSQYWVKVY